MISIALNIAIHQLKAGNLNTCRQTIYISISWLYRKHI